MEWIWAPDTWKSIDTILTKWGFPLLVLAYLAVEFLRPIRNILVDYFSSFKGYHVTQLQILDRLEKSEERQADALSRIEVRIDGIDKKAEVLLKQTLGVDDLGDQMTDLKDDLDEHRDAMENGRPNHHEPPENPPDHPHKPVETVRQPKGRSRQIQNPGVP
jgi:hypothetical protein